MGRSNDIAYYSTRLYSVILRHAGRRSLTSYPRSGGAPGGMTHVTVLEILLFYDHAQQINHLHGLRRIDDGAF
jgi:hypothetical protein